MPSVQVEKGLLGALVRKAPKAASPVLRSGVTRAGRVGVEFEHQGVKGWGVNETAARASWQQNRYANGVSVGKAFGRQSVAPLLARKTQLAATAARPVRTNPRAVIGKADKRHDRYEFIMRRSTKDEQRRQRRGNTIGGGILGAATGLGLGAYAGDLHYPARNHGRYATIGSVAGAGMGALLGHAAPRNKYTLDIDKEREPSGVGKGFAGDALKMVKTGRKVAGAGWKAGLTGTKPRMAIGTAVSAAHSPTMQRVGQAAQMAGEHPVITGAVGGSILGGGLVHERNINKVYAETRATSDGKWEYRDDNGVRFVDKARMPQTKRVRAFSLSKAQGDPEDARYYRLGAGSAGLAAAGAGGLAYAGREGHAATQIARRGAALGGREGKKGLPLMIELHDRKGNKIKAEVINQHRVHVADKLSRGGLAITRRGALAGAGGLAALGGAEALRRRANERRWN